MGNNTAIVAKLTNIRPIEGADKIRQATVSVHGVAQANVVIGLEEPENMPVVYFTSNMCVKAPLLDKYPDIGRYLGKAGRVRTVKLRGVISDGLVVGLDKFKMFDNFNADEGFEFTSIGSTEICARYEPPKAPEPTPKGKKKKEAVKKFNRLVEDQCRLHYDTDNFRRNAHKIDPDEIVSISRKCHGTSAVCAHVLTKKVLTWKEKLAKFFGIDIVETAYDYIYTSRTVVKNANINLGNQKHFYGFDLWTDAGEKYFKGKLAKGESVYYEIVGFLPSGGAIQKGYPYGCAPSTYKIMVYRMTMTNPDGVVFEYGWEQLVERCKEIGVDMVETYYVGTLRNLSGLGDDYTSGAVVDFLEKKYLGKKAPDCGNKIDEGIVLRVDHIHQAEAYKLKSYEFLHYESESFNNDNIDMEEQEGCAKSGSI